MAGGENAQTVAAGFNPAGCRHYYHGGFRKPDPSVPSGDIEFYLDKAGKSMGCLVVASSFLAALPVPGGGVVGSFLSCFADPFLCNYHGYDVADYRTNGVRRREGAGENGFLQPALFSDQTGNSPGHSAGCVESPYPGFGLAHAAGSGCDDFLITVGRDFSCLGQYRSCSGQATLSV